MENIADSHFDELGAELDHWDSLSGKCTLWWRDDDLIAWSPSFERLLKISNEHEVIPLVSVIPAQASPELGRRKGEISGLAVCQHGLAHVNHEESGAAKSEFGNGRPIEQVEKDVMLGGQIMGELFGEQFLPVFVPPWNSISDAALNILPKAGIIGLSRYGLRRADRSGREVRTLNAHIDIMDWGSKPSPLLQPPEVLIGALTKLLKSRRAGDVDTEEPIGILTHHRVMNEDSWQFIDRLIRFTRQFRSAEWISPIEYFARPDSVQNIQ